MITLLVYVDSRGRAPFSDWLRGLRDERARGVVRARLNRVTLGNYGDCKSLGEALYELRIDFGPGYRVYAAFESDSIVLLWGGDKSSQRRDIDRARRYLKDWRHEG